MHLKEGLVKGQNYSARFLGMITSSNSQTPDISPMGPDRLFSAGCAVRPGVSPVSPGVYHRTTYEGVVQKQYCLCHLH